MKINNLKNYFSLNIVSLLGFILCPYWAYKTYIQIPRIIEQAYILKSPRLDMTAYAKEVNLMFLLAIFLAVAIVLCLFALIEQILRKKGSIKSREYCSLIHNIIFWTGIILFALPYLTFLFI